MTEKDSPTPPLGGDSARGETSPSELEARTRELEAVNRELAAEIAERRRIDGALRESERRLQAVVSNAPVILWSLDRDGVFQLSEGRGLRLLGLEPGQLLGQSVFAVYASEPRIIENIRRAIAGETFVDEIEVGGIVFESWHSPRRDAEGHLDGMVGVAVDVTARVRAERLLRDSEERFALAVHGASDGLWDWNLRSDSVYYSPRWREMLGLEYSTLRGVPKDWIGRIHPDDLDRVRAGLAAHLAGATPHFEEEYRMLHGSGRWMWVLSRGIAVRDDEGRAYRMAGSQSDMSKRKAAEERLKQEALRDPLTGLPNRNVLLERLERAIARAAGDDYAFAVLFLDLDRFKLVNDGLGHLVGDRLLCQVANRLSDQVRPRDTFARLGGDEFTILVDELQNPVADVELLCDRLHEALREPFLLDDREVFTSASIGVAIGDGTYHSSEELLRDADTAMYRAKELGRARHVIFSSKMRAAAIAQLNLENDLRRAFQRGEFRVVYQPIVAIETGVIGGFEALIRWEHPTRGEVAPDDFLAAAEDTGLIIPVGRWLLREACRQMCEWERRFPGPPLGISVNLSSREFSRPDMVETISSVLAATGLAPSSLRLEITETLIMEHPDSVLTVLDTVKGLGVKLSIDDFGTGYSSLSRLHRFPIDTFKIDRSFVSRIDVPGENPEIIRAIVSLARNLAMDVIAEGIETEEQARALLEMGCFWGQGYLFARPLDNLAAASLLANHRPPVDVSGS